MIDQDISLNHFYHYISLPHCQVNQSCTPSLERIGFAWKSYKIYARSKFDVYNYIHVCSIRKYVRLKYRIGRTLQHSKEAKGYEYKQWFKIDLATIYRYLAKTEILASNFAVDLLQASLPFYGKLSISYVRPEDVQLRLLCEFLVVLSQSYYYKSILVVY